MRFTLIVLAGLFLLPIHAANAQELVFSPDSTEICLDGLGDAEKPGDCIGASATACMEATEGGWSTVGTGACLEAERAYWDQRLNVAYRALMEKRRADDAELVDLGYPSASLAVTLRDMQRAWIGFRDAACAYERAQWTGGSGAGPATLSCLMYRTGEQALYLETNLTGY